ncbi:hypothetical protein [Mycolicibacterium thermoresistibile]
MSAVDERQALSERAEQSGWQRRVVDHVDVYTRGTTRIRVIWSGAERIAGGSLYQDDIMTTYTRDVKAIDGWFTR